MKHEPEIDEDAARFKRVLQQISEVTVDEWEAKIAYYAAETARLELIEQRMMEAEPEPRARSIRQRNSAAPTAPALAKQTKRKIKIAN